MRYTLFLISGLRTRTGMNSTSSLAMRISTPNLTLSANSPMPARSEARDDTFRDATKTVGMAGGGAGAGASSNPGNIGGLTGLGLEQFTSRDRLEAMV